jgi:hypothetical protein
MTAEFREDSERPTSLSDRPWQRPRPSRGLDEEDRAALERLAGIVIAIIVLAITLGVAVRLFLLLSGLR